MVDISREGNFVHFEILGWHKLWAFKSSLDVSQDIILNVYQSEFEMSNIGGLRLLGTSIPNGICAGTFLFPEGKVFCDFINRDKVIIVELREGYYKKLYIEVIDPQEAIYFLAKP